MDKAQIINAAVKLIHQHAKPKRIWLFGSQNNNEAVKGSDIDIAFDDDNKPDLTDLKEAVNAIQTLIHVDIHNLAICGERFTVRVKETGRVLYSANKKLRAEDGLYNFNNALKRFKSMIDNRENLIKDGYGDMYLDLAVKRFEFTYEMAWKAIRRYVQYLGLECKSPRGCIKEGYAQVMIENETVWLDMIEMRNRTSHTYDESEIKEMLDKLLDYQQAFVGLKEYLEINLSPST